LNDSSKSNNGWFFDEVTTRGISFDGMMPHASKFPLGRCQITENKPFTTELIKPVSEMVKYLEVDEDLKNGYKLADVLTKTCFVARNKDVYDLFVKKQNEVLLKGQTQRCQIIKSQLQEDLENFNINDNMLKLSLAKTWNVKRVIYRSVTLFVSALGRMFGSSKNTNFDIICGLRERHIISENTAHLLSFAVAIACHFRLHRYMEKRSQDDDAQEHSVLGVQKFHRLLILIRQRELIKFFTCIFCLQNFFFNDTNLGQLNNYFQDLNYFRARLSIMTNMRLYNEIIDEGQQFLKTQNQNQDFFVLYSIGLAYMFIRNYPLSLTYFEQVKKSPGWFALSEDQTNMRISMLLAKLYNNESKSVLEETDAILLTKQHGIDYPDLFYLNGNANFSLKHYYKALGSFRNFLKSVNCSSMVDLIKHILAYKFVSICLLKCGHPNQALGWVFEALEMCDLFSHEIQHRFDCFEIIGDCYFRLGYFDQTDRWKNMHIEKLSGKCIVPEETLKLEIY